MPNATDMNPAPTSPGVGWGSPGRLDLPYTWLRETNPHVLHPQVGHLRRGAGGSWLGPCPALNARLAKP